MAKFQNGACDLFQPSVMKTALETVLDTDADTRFVIITDSDAKLPNKNIPNITIINVGDISLYRNDVINLIELQRECTSLDLCFQSRIKK